MNKRYIIFIILMAACLRLYHIDSPVSGWHSWRQSDTASIAKNFYENGFRILYPQINWSGNTSGFVESEFHLYPFLTALLYKVFGVADLWGRLLSLIFSVLTVYGIYLLVRQIISERTALWTALIYSIIPLNIFYGRAFMPESFLLMCSVFGIYFFYLWCKDNKIRYLVYSYIFITLAVLVKIPTLYLGLPLAFLSYNKFSIKFLKNRLLWIYAILLFIPVALWYYHAHQLFIQTGLTFNIWGFGSDKWGNFELLFSLKFYNDVFFKTIAERHLTYAFFIPFVIGLFIRRETKLERLFDWWMISVLIYIIIVARGNQLHEYYNLPFILPAVVIVAKAFTKYFDFGLLKNISVKSVRSYLFLLFLIAGILLSYLRIERLIHGENLESPLFHLAREVDSVTNEKDLIIAINDGSPLIFYTCNRRGWNAYADKINQQFVEDKINRGAKYLIGEHSYFNDIRKSLILEKIFANYKPLINKDEYFIIKLVK